MDSEHSSGSTLQSIAVVGAITGAVAAIGLMSYAGRRNSSVILMVLFAMWVVSPFVALTWAPRIARRWSHLTVTTCYGLLLVLTVVTPVIYGVIAFGPPRSQTAFTFLVVPTVSWVIAAIALAVSETISRKRARRE